MSDHHFVAIFWDYENCNPPSSPCGLGYDIVNNIGRIARLFGSVSTFRAYLDVAAQSPKSVALRSELQSSGVSIIDCPHNGKKDVVDKMILVDMLAFAVDHPAPATIVLITGDRDYAYAVSTLKLRKYQVILVVPSSPHTSPSLESQASLVIDWGAAALRARTETTTSAQVVRQPYLDLDVNLVTRLSEELQDFSPDDLDAAPQSCSTASQSASRMRRMNVRDLPESSRHSKNTASLDSAQEFTHNPASPRKFMNMASDPVSGGLPVPQTPSRSRRASVSTGSTRARSATVVTQSPPAVEQDMPTKNPRPSSARRSISPEIADITGSAKRGLSVLPSLDALQSLDFSGPPSSIIVRSPLEPIQSTGDMSVSGNLAHVVHNLDPLASPFVMTKLPTGPLKSVPDPSSKQSHAQAKPASPIIAPTQTLDETATVMCETSGITDIGVPKEIEHLKGLSIEDDDGSSKGSIPQRAHSQVGARDAPHIPKSNCHSYVASHAAYSPSSRNVVPVTGTSLGSHLSPPEGIFLGVRRDGVDPAQFAALPRASNTPAHPAPGPTSVLSTAVPSAPFATLESHETDESERRQTWTMFKPLIHVLLAARERGIVRSSRSTVAVELVQSDKQVYQRAGVSRFREYTAMAEQMGIIMLGGKEASAWIALHPNWFGVDGITTTHLPLNRVPSPTSDPPPKVTRDPFTLLTSSKTPVIEGAALLREPTPASPQRGSLESGDIPTDQHDSVSWAAIRARFQPLIDVLSQMQAGGDHQIRRSIVGQELSQDAYARAGASGFKEYIHQASEAQVIQLGGVGGFAWIGLHPELRV